MTELQAQTILRIMRELLEPPAPMSKEQYKEALTMAIRALNTQGRETDD